MNIKLLAQRSIVSLILGLLCFTTSWSQLSTDPKHDVMLQGFWWDSYQDQTVKSAGGLYNYLKAKAPQFEEAGFDMVWTPPPSEGGGMGYFPKQLFNFNSDHGNEADLRAMLADFKSRGIHGMADVVANHRNGTVGWAGFQNPVWDCKALVENDEVKGQSGQIQPCSGENDEGEGFSGVRDLNHKSTQVQQGFRDYLKKLNDIGFDSWRWDFTKGFPGKYVGEYNGSANTYFSVGEYWDGNIGLLTSWVNATGKTFTGTTNRSATFDFSLYYILERAVNGSWGELNNRGGMPGLAGTYGYADYAVTFVENHDTHQIQGNSNIMKANAYILTHPGIPMVYLQHWLSNKDKINELIAIRKLNKINAWSSVEIVASTNFYAAYIDGKVAVKLGGGLWDPAGSGWILNSSGTDYAVWSKIDIKNPVVTPVEPTLIVFPAISLTGSSVGGWGADVEMTTTDGITYNLKEYNFIAGSVKFRQDKAWTNNWGAIEFPSGTAIQAGKNIPVPEGTFSVTFNKTTGAYNFTGNAVVPVQNYAQITMVGSAVGGWSKDIPLTTTDGITYTVADYTFTGGDLKFRQDLSWSKNWGAIEFPSGTAIQAGKNIPVKEGKYTITFNAQTGAYNFVGNATTPVIPVNNYTVISIIGPAVGGWGVDTVLQTTDGVTYTLINHTFSAGDLKIREALAWTKNWGSANFPSGTGVQGGANIPVKAGVYTLTFDILKGTYTFSGQATAPTPIKAVGIIGTAVKGWDADVDMESTDGGKTYSLEYTLVAGDLKFRKDDAWDVNWGSANFPSGTGTQGGANIPVTAGTYLITFNTTTGAYNFKPVSGAKGTFNATTSSSIKLYPNPSTNTFQVDYDSTSDLDIQITVHSQAGQLVDQVQTPKHQLQAMRFGSEYATGIYFITIQQGEYTEMFKFIKQ